MEEEDGGLSDEGLIVDLSKELPYLYVRVVVTVVGGLPTPDPSFQLRRVWHDIIPRVLTFAFGERAIGQTDSDPDGLRLRLKRIRHTIHRSHSLLDRKRVIATLNRQSCCSTVAA